MKSRINSFFGGVLVATLIFAAISALEFWLRAPGKSITQKSDVGGPWNDFAVKIKILDAATWAKLKQPSSSISKPSNGRIENVDFGLFSQDGDAVNGVTKTKVVYIVNWATAGGPWWRTFVTAEWVKSDGRWVLSNINYLE